MKRQLLIVCVFYTVFVIYGSLVPWQFNGISINEAWSRFQNIPYLDLGIGSRADWVANILLFIPLAFLWLGMFSLNISLAEKIISTGVVLLSSIFLCSLIEFMQLFFPPRTVSLNDIVAESLGAIIGIASWWGFGGKFLGFLENFCGKKPGYKVYLQVYLAGLFFYNVMPLDLTISPVELYHKWKAGRIILMPFSGLKGDFVADVYDSLSDIVLWVPVPWLWIKQKRLNTRQLLVRVFFAASIIESMQLFVFTRVTDVTDILLAIGGSVFGVWLARFDALIFIKGANQNNQAKAYYSFYVGFAFCLWVAIILAIFWYPYDFQWNYSHFSMWAGSFFKIPFYAYYYGSEFRAITEVFHKVLLFSPLGVILGFIVGPTKGRHQALLSIWIMIGVVALGVEFGQLFLPGKNADITDVILEILGGQVGFIVSQKLSHRSVIGRQGGIDEKFQPGERGAMSTVDEIVGFQQRRSVITNSYSTTGSIHKFGLLLACGGGGSMLIGLIFASRSERVPYNVRELFSADYPVFSALGITLLIYWCFSYPLFFLIRMLKKKQWQSQFCIKEVIIHSLGAWLLIRAIVPMESIYDIVGSPILAIPQELEIMFRFVALFSVYSLMMLGATHSALLTVFSIREFKRLFFLWMFWLLLMLPMSYWVVVIEAATDNLTELMANGGYSFFIINICFYFFLFGWLGVFASLVIVFKTIREGFVVFSIFLISIPLGYYFFMWGTESVILKYNSVFSAMQFLLSSDRKNLASEDVLQVRFAILHISLILMVIMAQLPVLVFFYDFIKSKSKNVRQAFGY